MWATPLHHGRPAAIHGSGPHSELALDAAVADLAGCFADQAVLPRIPGLPSLQGFQRRQLAVTLPWAARRLGLPPPGWVEAL